MNTYACMMSKLAFYVVGRTADKSNSAFEGCISNAQSSGEALDPLCERSQGNVLQR